MKCRKCDGDWDLNEHGYCDQCYATVVMQRMDDRELDHWNKRGSNPVFVAGGEWYWYDETWTNVSGPYDCEEEAVRACEEYVNNL